MTGFLYLNLPLQQNLDSGSPIERAGSAAKVCIPLGFSGEILDDRIPPSQPGLAAKPRLWSPL